MQSCHDAACHSEENIDDVSDIVDDRSQDIRIGIGFAAVFGKTVIEFVELFSDLALVVKYLDDLLTVHYLLNVAFGSGNGFLLPDKVLG